MIVTGGRFLSVRWRTFGF